jgi:putative intracellular protease/amidase
MKKILIVVTNHAALGNRGKQTGLWLRELTDFYHEVRPLFDVDIISTSPNRVPIDPRSLLEVLADKKTRAYYKNDELMDRLKMPLVPEEVDANDYGAIYFAGGHGTMWDFPDNQKLQELTKTIYENGGVVSAVCHGPAALVNVKLSDGRYLLAGHVVTGFSDMEEKFMFLYKAIPFSLEEKLRERGALFTMADLPFTKCIHTSGRLITGQNPASAQGVALKLIESLQGAKAERQPEKAEV